MDRSGHAGFSLLLGLSLALVATPPAVAGSGTAVQAWLSTNDGRQRMQPLPDAGIDAGAAPMVHIEVDPAHRFQRMVGFGAALTDASAWLLARQMSPSQRGDLLRELFGREDDGIGLDFTRLTIGASDFSRHHYSYDDMPPGRVDPELVHFSIAPARGEVIPVLREALAINPRLQVMASPWSAPGWMKTSDSLVQGTLWPEYYGAFARYLLAYVDAMDAEGIPLFALTLQNEPAFEPGDYPGMRLGPRARASIIGHYLGPLLERRRERGAPAPLLLEWDHNWDKPGQPLAVLADPLAAPHVAGVAWHCYGGDVSAQSQVHDAYPELDTYLTECSGGDWEPVRSGGLVQQARSLVVETTRNWARGVLFWNLALDPDNGPHKGGCGTCRGLVTIAPDGSFTRTDDYYALAHASRFVRQGAWRIGSSEAHADVANVAFENADDGSRVLLVVNSATAPRGIQVEGGGTSFSSVLPGTSVATFVWHPVTAAATTATPRSDGNHP